MKELVPNQVLRFLIYFSLALLSMTTLYGTFFVVGMYRMVSDSRVSIAVLEKRMSERETVAAKYVPMLDGVQRLVDQHSELLRRIMERQRDINLLIERPLKKLDSKR